MNLGERLLEFRKSKNLSQEEVAEKLNVSRQTVSKWESNASTPDFKKIVPLCDLFEISTDELLKGVKEEVEETVEKSDTFINPLEIRKKKAKGLSIGILLYFVAVMWIMITIPVFNLNPILSAGIFLLICGISTAVIIYTCIVYKKEKIADDEDPLIKKIDNIVSIITLIVYLLISFITMAWHITWIIWIIYALVMEIIKLIFMLRGDKNEE